MASSRPVGGTDYPRTRQEFRMFFPGDAACLDYLVRVRWPAGFACPRCGGAGWLTARGTYACEACGRQTSPTAGTVFEGTRKPLLDWFEVMWSLTTDKGGSSALRVSRDLRLGSYETAWAWLHKLRRAMVRPEREMLSGEVEVDETLVGGVEEGVSGRQTFTKAIVVIAVEMLPARPGATSRPLGRIRLARVPDASAASLHPFVLANVKPGSTLLTDAWKGYLGLNKKGYTHRQTNIKRSGRTGSELLPGVHMVASHLDRWWLGTHHGAIRHRHLDAYLDEFVFRFNRRNSRTRGLLFYRLMEGAVSTDAVPLRELWGGVP